MRSLAVAAVAFGAMFGAANAAIVGVAVNPGNNATVGDYVTRPAPLGANSIQYFVPLGDGSGTYGVTNSGNFGRVADSGNGGGTLSLFLRFTGLTIGQSYNLVTVFEDLDVLPVNDPANFTERLQIFNSSNVALTGALTSLGNFAGGSVTGDSTAQTLVLALGAATANTLTLRLDFTANFNTNGTNTAEFLNAQLQPVPLPAAFPLMMAGVAGLGFAARRKRAAA